MAKDIELKHFRFEGMGDSQLSHMCGTVPHLIRLGDGSLWQFDRQTWNSSADAKYMAGYTIWYRPAVVEEIKWVYPTEVEANG